MHHPVGGSLALWELSPHAAEEAKHSTISDLLFDGQGGVLHLRALTDASQEREHDEPGRAEAQEGVDLLLSCGPGDSWSHSDDVAGRYYGRQATDGEIELHCARTSAST